MQNRKRLTFLAAMAAVFSLFGGGANAFAVTIRCVPSTGLDPACTRPTTYPNIQAAVTASSAGDIIVVGPGTYPESVTIPPGKDGLSLFGAQAGNDARHDRDNPAKESIVNATVLGGSAIIVESKNVIINGFTAQGGVTVNATGIDLKGTGGGLPLGTDASGGKVLNNILQDNGTGVSLNSEGFGPISNVLVKRNLFRHNNGGCPACGDGLFTSAMNNVVITENAFSENKTSALGVNNSSNVVMTYNESKDDGSFVIFTGTTNSEFSNNEGKDFGAMGTFPGAGDAAVAIGPGNSNLVISYNDLKDGTSPISRGIAITSLFGPGSNTKLIVSYNKVKHFPASGIAADASTLNSSLFIGNESDNNGTDGISLKTGDSGNFLTENKAHGNTAFDCHDTSTGGPAGSPTFGTLNTWFRNTGKTSSPAGLCTKGDGD